MQAANTGFDPIKTTETMAITETPRSPIKDKDRVRKRGTGFSDGTSRTNDRSNDMLKSTSDGESSKKDEDNYDITMRLLEQYS